MPIHDWRRVHAGTYHHFHNNWIAELSKRLNNGLLPDDFWNKHSKGMESWKKESKTYYKVTGPLCPQLLVNEFVWLEALVAYCVENHG